VPESKGTVCYVRDGLIHMEGINQRFSELVWLNSHFATRELALNGKVFCTGKDLPEHRRVRLSVEKRER